MDVSLSPVRQEVFIAAPPERVFEAWTNPEEITRWYVEDADGDPRKDEHVEWILRGESLRFEVTQSEPGKHLVLTDVSGGPWDGTIVEVLFESEDDGTLLTVSQEGFHEGVRRKIPEIASSWGCVLAILKEYLEEHAGMRREYIEVRSDVVPNPLAVATALRSAEAIQHWMVERPERVLVRTPHAAVVKLEDFPGVFMLSGAGNVSVWYCVWGGSAAEDAIGRAQEIVDRFVERVLALARPVG